MDFIERLFGVSGDQVNIVNPRLRSRGLEPMDAFSDQVKLEPARSN